MKVSRPFQIIVVLAILGGTYFWTTSEDAPASGATTRRERATSTAPKLDGPYTEQDLTAVYEPYNSAPKNSFRPGVLSSRGAGAGSMASAQANSIPSVFASGEPDWFFTGVADLDGKRTALVESVGKREGDFLSVGTRWKSSTVVSITDSTLTLAGPNGSRKTIELDIILPEYPEVAAGSTRVAPLNPMAGAIGGGISVSPMNSR